MTKRPLATELEKLSQDRAALHAQMDAATADGDLKRMNEISQEISTNEQLTKHAGEARTRIEDANVILARKERAAKGREGIAAFKSKAPTLEQLAGLLDAAVESVALLAKQLGEEIDSERTSLLNSVKMIEPLTTARLNEPLYQMQIPVAALLRHRVIKNRLVVGEVITGPDYKIRDEVSKYLARMVSGAEQVAQRSPEGVAE